MKRLFFSVTFLIFTLLLVTNARAQYVKSFMLDDFEGQITAGPMGTVDFGAGNGSSVNVSASTDIKYSGKQSLKVEYDAVAGGYIWIARGYDLDVRGAARWNSNPKDINWKDYDGITFYMYAGDSKGNIAFDIKDNGNEMWRFITKDNYTGWQHVICPFEQFISRSDWQPNNADKNDVLDFPIKSFQFEPLPEAKSVLYFDAVELVQTKK